MELEAVVALAQISELQGDETGGVFRRVKGTVDTRVLGSADWRRSFGREGGGIVSTYAISTVSSGPPACTHFALCSFSCCSRRVTRAMSWSVVQVDKSGGS